MRIPASRLSEHLTPGTFYNLRASDYNMAADSVPYTEAVAMAVRGSVEGIATPAGKIKYLRLLTDSEREPEDALDALDCAESLDAGRSTVFTNLHMGAYREEVESSQMNEWGMPTRIVIGHIWQLYGVNV